MSKNTYSQNPKKGPVAGSGRALKKAQRNARKEPSGCRRRDRPASFSPCPSPAYPRYASGPWSRPRRPPRPAAEPRPARGRRRPASASVPALPGLRPPEHRESDPDAPRPASAARPREPGHGRSAASPCGRRMKPCSMAVMSCDTLDMPPGASIVFAHRSTFSGSWVCAGGT